MVEKVLETDSIQSKLSNDYLAAFIIGILASFLSLIVLINLNAKVSYFIPFLVLIPMTLAGIAFGHFVGKKVPALFQFIRFGETGGLNWLVDFGVLNLLILFTGVSTGLVYSLFKALSFLVSVANSFFWNKHWVFKDRAKTSTEEFGKFALISIIGLFVNVGIASFLAIVGNNVLPLDSKIWANLAAAFGSLIAMVWNFVEIGRAHV